MAKPFVDGKCPGCGASETRPVEALKAWRFNGEKVELTDCGYRLACQRCPEIFSVNAHGMFRHHPGSLPRMGPMPIQEPERGGPPKRDPLLPNPSDPLPPVRLRSRA